MHIQEVSDSITANSARRDSSLNLRNIWTLHNDVTVQYNLENAWVVSRILYNPVLSKTRPHSLASRHLGACIREDVKSGINYYYKC